MQRSLLLGLGHRVPVESFRPHARRRNIRPTIVTFSGLDSGAFLIGRHKEIHAELLRILQPIAILDPQLNPHWKSPFLAIHVRCGDFQSVNEAALRAAQPNVRQPITWFVAALRALRTQLAQLGFHLPALIFSDGTDTELSPLLTEPAISQSPYHTAIEDLQLMWQAVALIGSRSTFSAWASFLGQVPTVYFPGARPIQISALRSSADFALEPEWDYGDTYSEAFIAAVLKRLGGETITSL